MTTTFENSKGYKVLTLSADEIKVWPRAKVCDRCARKIGSSGFYVGAYNLMYCPACYEEWHNSTPEKQKLQDLRENTHLAKAIVHITEALSKNKSRIKVHCSTHKHTISQKIQHIAYVSNTILHWILGMDLRPAPGCLRWKFTRTMLSNFRIYPKYNYLMFLSAFVSCSLI